MVCVVVNVEPVYRVYLDCLDVLFLIQRLDGVVDPDDNQSQSLRTILSHLRLIIGGGMLKLTEAEAHDLKDYAFARDHGMLVELHDKLSVALNGNV